MSKDKEQSDRFIKRAQFEEQHHKVFDYKQKNKLCIECGEKNGIPNDPRSFVETSGIRIGTAAETTRGHDETWFRQLAHRIADIIGDE